MWTSFGDHYSVCHKEIRDKGSGEDSFTTLFESEEALGGAKALRNYYVINSD